MAKRLDKNTAPLFADFPNDNWEKEWQGMPEFKQEHKLAVKSIKVNFRTGADMPLFAELVQQPLTKDTRSIWFPKGEIDAVANLAYVDED